ncbi:MAG: Gfo/Idh/MocA family oxidoreductase [Chloroflexi bacterium]|nr:Gfo/Idh/MocA family oxidoreductase [Chloroflexota bacterium]
MRRFLASGLDAVAICTPPQAHAVAIEAALLGGQHVLVEKPMTIVPADGARLAELAASRGLLLCPAHNFLFARSMQRLSNWLSDGSAGEVRFVMGLQTSSWRRRLPTWFDELPGGLFFDESPHLLYLMRRCLGDLRVERAWLTPFDDREASGEPSSTAFRDRRIEARLTGERGAGYLSMWFGAPLSEWALVVACSRSVIVVDLFRDIAVRLPEERGHGRADVIATVASATYQVWAGIGATAARVLGGEQRFGHDRLVRGFVDAIEGGTPPTDAVDGVRVVELIDRIWRTASNASE